MLKNKPVPLPLETGMMVMKIGRALQDSLLSGERIQFNEKGNRLDEGVKMMNGHVTANDK